MPLAAGPRAVDGPSARGAHSTHVAGEEDHVGMWLWVIAVFVPVAVAAVWVEGRRGSLGEYRSADLPATKHGRPRPVDFDHTVGPCDYDVGPEGRSGPIGTSARTAYRGRP